MMEWFNGSIAEAIQRAKGNGSIFIVFISGAEVPSTAVLDQAMNSATVVNLATENKCVAIKIEDKSQSGQQFSQIYPVLCIPSIFFIDSSNGNILEICSAAATADTVSESLNNAIKKKRGPTDAVSSDGADGQAAASKTPEDLKEKPQHIQSRQDSNQEITSPAENVGGGTVMEDNMGGACGGSEEAEGETLKSLEEKQERAEALLATRRQQKNEEAKEKAKKEEMERRKLGKEMTEFKNWKADMERKEIENSMKKEREEAKRAREKVKEDIERDRRERALRYQTQQENERIVTETKREAKAAAEAEELCRKQAERRESSRIQFRLPDGSSVTQVFSSSETLSAARDFIKQKLNVMKGVTLVCTFPKRTFTDNDMASTLLDLDLAPSAALIVLLSTSKEVNKVGDTSDGFIAYITSALLALWLFLVGLFTGTPNRDQVPTSNPANPSSAQNSNMGESGTGSAGSHTRTRQTRGETSGGGGMRRRKEGNIHRLKFGDDDDDDEDNATWNGNSTQQM